MIVAQKVFSIDGLMRNVLQTTNMVSAGTARANRHCLGQVRVFALLTVMPRTTEHAGMLIFIEGEIGCFASARKVIETATVMLRAFDNWLRTHVAITVAIQNASRAKRVGECLDVVIAQPLLVEGKLTFAAFCHFVSFMSSLSTEHTCMSPSTTLTAFPFSCELFVLHTERVELTVASSRTGHKRAARLFGFTC